MNIKYEYEIDGKVHRCPFKAYCELGKSSVVAILQFDKSSFVVLPDDVSEGESAVVSQCHPITTKIKPWTALTAPFPLALRKKGWPKGSYWLFEAHCEDAIACYSYDGSGGVQKRNSFTWEELASPDSEWETRDGLPCGEVCDE